MKIRTGFVSNSSSSSFVCDISGYSDSTTENMRDIGFACCEKGHTIYFGENKYPTVTKFVEDDDNTYSDIPSEICPICNGDAKSAIAKRMLSHLKHCGITPEDLMVYLVVQ